MTDRVLLIGIDGASWNFVDEYMAGGHMPNLSRLVENGVRAPLKSVLPLNSASAWTSIATGKSPGGHGVFGFARGGTDSYKRRPVGPADVEAATVWEIWNAAGKRAGVINYPITWPPPELDGFLVSGILVPHNALWANPPGLEKELRGLFGPYMVDVAWAMVDETKPGDRENFLRDLYVMTRKQEEVALECMSMGKKTAAMDWSLFCVALTGTDRIMHRFWHMTDPEHPARDAGAAAVYGDEIRKYFSLVDSVVGRIIHAAGEATCLVVSDHGFGPLYRRFYLRKWLERNGFLVEGPFDSAEVDESLEGIDMARTAAFPATFSDSGVWINLEGRQPCGTVKPSEYNRLRERMIECLESFEIDGVKPVRGAWRREDVVKGEYADGAPDILIDPSEGFIVSDEKSDSVIELSLIETGTHRPTGIFAASGPGIARGTSLKPLRAVDVLPTLLTAAGAAIPEDVEGEPAMEIFETPRPVAKCAPVKPARMSSRDGSDDEDEKRRNQLKGLGYI